jgi:hypothetical protein
MESFNLKSIFKHLLVWVYILEKSYSPIITVAALRYSWMPQSGRALKPIFSFSFHSKDYLEI